MLIIVEETKNGDTIEVTTVASGHRTHAKEMFYFLQYDIEFPTKIKLVEGVSTLGFEGYLAAS